MPKPSFAQSWGKKVDTNVRLMRTGRVVIERYSTRIHVVCPPREEFKEGARELDAKWKYRSRVWSFPGGSLRFVKELCERVYGKEAITMVGFPAE